METKIIELTEDERRKVRSDLIRSESIFRSEAEDQEDPYKAREMIKRADETKELIKKFEK